MLSRHSSSSKTIIQSSIDKVWDVLSRDSHLELVHPFCKTHKKIVWNRKEKKDFIEYLNGIIYYRTFYDWREKQGFKLMIGKKNGKKSRVVWDLRSSNQGVLLTIIVTPYVSKKYNRFLSFVLMKIYVIPLLNKYLENVTKGIKYYVEEGIPVKKNQFGKHKWFS